MNFMPLIGAMLTSKALDSNSAEVKQVREALTAMQQMSPEAARAAVKTGIIKETWLKQARDRVANVPLLGAAADAMYRWLTDDATEQDMRILQLTGRGIVDQRSPEYAAALATVLGDARDMDGRGALAKLEGAERTAMTMQLLEIEDRLRRLSWFHDLLTYINLDADDRLEMSQARERLRVFSDNIPSDDYGVPLP